MFGEIHCFTKFVVFNIKSVCKNNILAICEISGHNFSLNVHPIDNKSEISTKLFTLQRHGNKISMQMTRSNEPSDAQSEVPCIQTFKLYISNYANTTKNQLRDRLYEIYQLEIRKYLNI